MYGVLPQDSKENQWQMVSAKRDHWQTSSDERSGEPPCRPVGVKPRRLLLDVGKFGQSIGRLYELRTHGEIGRRGHILLHGEHQRVGRGFGGGSQREADCRYARPLHSRSGTLGGRSGQHPLVGE